MAKDKTASWAERRWKIFELEYQSNSAFRDQLAEATQMDGLTSRLVNVGKIIREHNVPAYCVDAVLLFLRKPDLDRQDYIKLISHPMIYWSSTTNVIGPDFRISASHYINSLLDTAGIEVTKDGKPISGEKLAKIISRDGVTLQLNPYLTKTEVKELIDEYWDELNAMLKIPSEVDDDFYSTKLLGKVQPTKPKGQAERDALIMKLHDEGMNDEQIQYHLKHETNNKYTAPDPSYIRVIRSRNKPKKS